MSSSFSSSSSSSSSSLSLSISIPFSLSLSLSLSPSEQQRWTSCRLDLQSRRWARHWRSSSSIRHQLLHWSSSTKIQGRRRKWVKPLLYFCFCHVFTQWSFAFALPLHDSVAAYTGRSFIVQPKISCLVSNLLVLCLKITRLSWNRSVHCMVHPCICWLLASYRSITLQVRSFWLTATVCVFLIGRRGRVCTMPCYLRYPKIPWQ